MTDYDLISNIFNKPPSEVSYYTQGLKDQNVYMNFGGDGLYLFEVKSNRDHTFPQQICNALNRIKTLFGAIKHGDKKHRDWLEQAIKDHFNGQPVKREK